MSLNIKAYPTRSPIIIPTKEPLALSGLINENDC
jgi:hypothetical protein